jgi:8-oxo-dGTP pyrophosphatase MutT (NUDIX family)
MVEIMTYKLRNKLQEDLPGWKAQRLMATQLHREERAVPRPDAKRAGIMILFYPQHSTFYMPLILRPTYSGVHSGQVAFPGGKMEKTDKNIIETALRETHEEIGVWVDNTHVIGQLSDIYISPSNSLVSPVIALIEEKPLYHINPHEVVEVIDVSLDDLINPDNQKIAQIQIPGRGEVDAPSYQINGHTIWGATAMMISELLVLLSSAD